MEYLVGAGLALAVSLFATLVGLDRDRAFYPTLLMVIASYYALFAVMGAAPGALARESVAIAGFLLVSIVGFKHNPWVLVGGLCAHGLFDFSHAYLIANSGVPAWWPGFCLTYDVAAGTYLAWRLSRSQIDATLRPAASPSPPRSSARGDS
jgi:hypothetical protein